MRLCLGFVYCGLTYCICCLLFGLVCFVGLCYGSSRCDVLVMTFVCFIVVWLFGFGMIGCLDLLLTGFEGCLFVLIVLWSVVCISVICWMLRWVTLGYTT